MRCLVVASYAGDGILDWSMRAIAAGHEVKWFVADSESIDRENFVGKGIIERVSSLWDYYKWADLIIYTDNVKWLQAVEPLRAKGWPVISATPESASWELDRSKGQAIFRKAGIPTLPEREFSDYDSAMAFVKKTMKRYVSKPSGPEPDKALSYVSKSPADMVYMLQRWKRAGKKMRFILQEFQPGIEMAVGAWFGPQGFLPGWCENFEHKKLATGGLGPNVGEMGTALYYTKTSKLADKVLKPLEAMLARTGHVGYVDVNCIIDDKGQPFPLEFTMRFGWPCFNIQCALHQGDPVEWLATLVLGQSMKQPFKLNEPAVGVVMVFGDYPHSKWTKKMVSGIPVYGLDRMDQNNIHPCQMMMGDAPVQKGESIGTEKMLVTAGDYVLVVTGTGANVKAASALAYDRVGKIELPCSPFWRTDIARGTFSETLRKAQSMGYATAVSIEP